MTLPLPNPSPKYPLTIPSTQQAVTYKSFLVRHEKILMVAQESGDESHMVTAVTDVVRDCLEGDYSLAALTAFDIDYIFLKIRSKSIGETSDVELICQACEHPHPHTIDLEAIEVAMPALEKVVSITDTIKVEMQWPSYQRIRALTTANNAKTADQFFGLVRGYLVAIVTEQERIALADHPEAEVNDFIESLTSQQFEKIKAFIDATPSLRHTIDFTCTACSHANSVTLEGIQAFFP